MVGSDGAGAPDRRPHLRKETPGLAAAPGADFAGPYPEPDFVVSRHGDLRRLPPMAARCRDDASFPGVSQKSTALSVKIPECRSCSPQPHVQTGQSARAIPAQCRGL
ncbi:hypothetical protein [Gluconobacter oxydans]|uniref:hypothetical protein n=1 Tax=Gluconobacter oxydans TaxID=442 RepID=UPI001F38B185|nr:hypothetical protein [Gluconobacter oxydans]